MAEKNFDLGKRNQTVDKLIDDTYKENDELNGEKETIRKSIGFGSDYFRSFTAHTVSEKVRNTLEVLYDIIQDNENVYCTKVTMGGKIAMKGVPAAQSRTNDTVFIPIYFKEGMEIAHVTLVFGNYTGKSFKGASSDAILEGRNTTYLPAETILATEGQGKNAVKIQDKIADMAITSTAKFFEGQRKPSTGIGALLVHFEELTEEILKEIIDGVYSFASFHLLSKTTDQIEDLNIEDVVGSNEFEMKFMTIEELEELGFDEINDTAGRKFAASSLTSLFRKTMYDKRRRNQPKLEDSDDEDVLYSTFCETELVPRPREDDERGQLRDTYRFIPNVNIKHVGSPNITTGHSLMNIALAVPMVAKTSRWELDLRMKIMNGYELGALAKISLNAPNNIKFNDPATFTEESDRNEYMDRVISFEDEYPTLTLDIPELSHMAMVYDPFLTVALGIETRGEEAWFGDGEAGEQAELAATHILNAAETLSPSFIDHNISPEEIVLTKPVKLPTGICTDHNGKEMRIEDIDYVIFEQLLDTFPKDHPDKEKARDLFISSYDPYGTPDLDRLEALDILFRKKVKVTGYTYRVILNGTFLTALTDGLHDDFEMIDNNEVLGRRRKINRNSTSYYRRNNSQVGYKQRSTKRNRRGEHNRRGYVRSRRY